ncbi:MAG: AIPR family protein [Flavobacteriales bacterium]|nr:AIPR family protein [Flavobacteriales bacterium]
MGRLYDLYGMFRHMGSRFFERNIRHSLPEDGSVNRILERAFRDIGIDKKLEPAMFAFNHNGVTFSAQQIEPDKNGYRITEPRLLNGAQTITTMARFIEKNKGRDDIETIEDRLPTHRGHLQGHYRSGRCLHHHRDHQQQPPESGGQLESPCKRPDPVELSDHFRSKLGMYYERQQRAFEGLTEEERDEQGITDDKAVQVRSNWPRPSWHRKANWW